MGSPKMAILRSRKLKSVDLKEQHLLEIFLKEVGRFKILDPEEQSRLGTLARSIVEEERVIAGTGDIQARNKLVEHSLRLVVWLAKKAQNGALPVMDIIQEGSIGLITAAERFDADKGIFSTYAVWWISQAISRAFENLTQTIRVPVHAQEFSRKVWREYIKMSNELQRDPSIEELAERLLMPQEALQQALDEMRNALQYKLDQPLEEGDGAQTFYDIVPNKAELQPDQYVEAKDEQNVLIQNIMKVLNKLVFYSEREKNIFAQRYGLNETLTQHTLEEVGNIYFVTRERIRQIIERVWYRSVANGLDKGEGWLYRKINLLNTFINITHDTSITRLLRLPAVTERDGQFNDDFDYFGVEEALYDSSDPNILLISLICSIYDISMDQIFEREETDQKILWIRDIVAYSLKTIMNLESKEIAEVLDWKYAESVEKAIKRVTDKFEDLEVQKEVSSVKSKFILVFDSQISTLYDYQQIAYDAITKRFRTHNRALMTMATGLGKTVVSAFFAKEEVYQKKRGLFLCHENHILQQAFNSYRKILGCNPKLKKFYGKYKDWNHDDTDILFASFQSLKEWHTVFDKDHFDFIIVDESHHGQAPTYKEVIEYFTPAKLLGMTATPDREDGKDIRDIFGEEVVNYSLEEALAKGWVTPVEYRVMSDDIDTDKLKLIAHNVKEENERISVNKLNKTIFVRARDIEIVKKIQRYSELKKTVIFCESIDHAEMVAQFLPRAVTFHSKKMGVDNKRCLHSFKIGQAQYILTVNKFNEGIDIPHAEVIVFLRSTESKIIFLQQLGRGLRKLPGKEKVLILDFVVNCERIILLEKISKRIANIADERNHVPRAPSGKISINKFYTGQENLYISGEGFDFIFTDHQIEILEIINRSRLDFYSRWQDASESSLKIGITGRYDYRDKYKKDPKLPSNPEVYYSDFPNWKIFLGKGDKKFYSTWRKASKAALKLGIKNQRDYYKLYKKDPKLPSAPAQYYAKFPNWIKFLGNERNFYLTWQEAGEAAKKLGCTSHAEYMEKYRQDKRLFSTPSEYYEDFPGFKVFLGVKEEKQQIVHS